jgi:hypothetical protein
MSQVNNWSKVLWVVGCMMLGSLLTMGARGLVDTAQYAWASPERTPTLPAMAVSTPAPIRALVPYKVVDTRNTTWCVSLHNGHTFPPITQP